MSLLKFFGLVDGILHTGLWIWFVRIELSLLFMSLIEIGQVGKKKLKPLKILKISSITTVCVWGGGKILSINYIELEDVRTDESITNAYQTVRKQIPIGNQYDWLARFAVDHPGSELGIEKPYGEYSGCVDAIERFGKLKKQDISWIIDSDYSSPELCLLFGNFSFPIIRLTELEMVENIKQ